MDDVDAEWMGVERGWATRGISSSLGGRGQRAFDLAGW